MNDINWKEVLRETVYALITLALFIPAMIVIYGMLATYQ